MLNTKTSFYFLLISLGSLSVKAQDSLSLFKTINNQYNVERNFKAQYYYNPASMSGYSSSSFSEFGVGYQGSNENMYRQQLGNGDKGLTIKATSFKKLKPNRFVWGNASYQNIKTGVIRWNENLDYDRIAPYAAADSVGGKLNVERYQFAGGYLQKMNRWTVAGQVSYLAQLGYRSRDPRLRSTTSDLRINAGVNYKVFREYEVGIFGEFSKYTQNNSLTFQSALGRPYVYQMVGLGYSNNLFNGGTTPSSTFEEFGVKGGLQISGKGGNDFYLQASIGRANNIKSYKNTGNTFYDTSDLADENFQFEGAKFFDFNEKHRIGLLANFTSSVKTGSEYGYSVNSVASMTQIFKRKAFRRENYITAVKGFYQYQQDHFSITATPFYGYEEIKERRLYPNAGQKFVYSYFGLNVDYKQQINENQVLTFQPYFSKRAVNKSINALTATGNVSVDEWILQDNNFQASDITTFGTSLRYDFKLEKLPAFFVSAQYQSQKIQKKNNNFAGASIGITF
ncbi:hypothetical protein ACM39_17835 [Chryseobacterium sp. FH2]|uniref:DUF6850 family outer membrane beta-barrel protein n=1 Tax=Chryseobacterium sp. FH2 TaxID=1674291 RepID=UPI00065AF5C2|nr:DUF6850 family outer membrane beta-barrel protein [Chryseobacterium sp. FH2]KMQ61278.1 hypothetical protein ACM39_17835 [Chryseobacterium sp. FH2]